MAEPSTGATQVVRSQILDVSTFGSRFHHVPNGLRSDSIAWPGVLGGRFLDRFGAGFRSAPRDALIASSVSDEYRGRAFGLEGIGDNLGAFLGPLLAVLLFLSSHFHIRWIFLLAIVPGLLAFLMILLVHEQPVPVAANSKIDVSLREFQAEYWKYLVVIAIFEIGNSSNSFLILQAKSIGASFAVTILIYAGFNLVATLISYPAGSLSEVRQLSTSSGAHRRLVACRFGGQLCCDRLPLRHRFSLQKRRSSHINT